MLTNEVIVTVLVALLGGSFLGSIVQGVYQRRKLGADYADVIAKSATSLLTPLATRVEELQDELAAERARVRSLARDLDLARDSLEQARRGLRMLRTELEATRQEERRGRDDAR